MMNVTGLFILENGSAYRESYVKGNRSITKTSYYDQDGNVKGSIGISKPLPKKLRKLRYNFKELSKLILGAKTSGSAKQAISKARLKAASLRKKLKNGEYDDSEVTSAIIHADRMIRIARKKYNHLKEEEAAERNMEDPFVKFEEEEDDTLTATDFLAAGDDDEETDTQMSREEIERLMQEMERLMEQAMEQSEEELEFQEELDAELTQDPLENLEPEDLEQRKKKHRSDELRMIVEADMKYLKTMFDRLEREKQSLMKSGISQGSSAGDNRSYASSGSSPSGSTAISDAYANDSTMMMAADIGANIDITL